MTRKTLPTFCLAILLLGALAHADPEGGFKSFHAAVGFSIAYPKSWIAVPIPTGGRFTTSLGGRAEIVEVDVRPMMATTPLPMVIEETKKALFRKYPDAQMATDSDTSLGAFAAHKLEYDVRGPNGQPVRCGNVIAKDEDRVIVLTVSAAPELYAANSATVDEMARTLVVARAGTAPAEPVAASPDVPAAAAAPTASAPAASAPAAPAGATAASPAASPPASTRPAATAFHSKSGYSITAPKGWQITRLGNGEMFTSPGPRRETIMIGVSHTRATSLQELADESRNQIPGRSHNITIQVDEDSSIGGLPARKFEYEALTPERVRVSDFVCWADGKSINLGASAPADLFDALRPMIDEMRKSVVLDP